MRLVSLCTIVSRILGLLRDQAMGAIFGAGPLLDAFTVAFRLPNLARVLLGEGALTTAFLPVFMEELHERGRDSAARLTWAVFFCLTGVLCTLILVAEGVLLTITQCFDLGPESRLLCNLTAYLLPYVLMICLAAQVGAVLNALGRFLWPALVPSILNLVWLIAMWKVVPLWSDEISRIYATAACVVIGGGLQLLFPLPILFASGFGYRRDWREALGSVRRIAMTMLPVILGLSITQLNAVLDSFVAWGFTRPETHSASNWFSDISSYPLPEGTATALYLGQRLYQFPLGVFGVALGTVLFPLLTSHAQRGETDKLRADLSLGIRLVLAIGLPASAGLMLIAHPLSTAFFEYGRFDAEAAHQTGTMIAAYSSGVWAYCGLLILQRGFYAIGDRLTPMYLGMAAMLGNLILDLTLIWPFGGKGLAFSTALIAAVQCAATVRLLQLKIGPMHWQEIGRTGVKTLFATGVMSILCLMMFAVLDGTNFGSGRFVRLGLPLLVGVVGFLIMARLIRLDEPWQILAGRHPKNADKSIPDPAATAD
ncbi:murein biosynthesis integral membrane protein MurJ [Schlesneria paludicola]|uniref:murein biosynthesis integral membrane protein MurJ n=1 Tax=Schlesneria paludicola TaxID=360056 RepID=UPI0012F7222E|nr:murein biosynthesis integral membrane protein MurJ [Schlesneria paludicola]